MIIVFWLIFGALFAFLCSKMAKSRNRDSTVWGVLGFIFGIFALIVLAVMGNAETPAIAMIPAANKMDEIAKLKQLLDGGAITQAEFDAQKAKLLA